MYELQFHSPEIKLKKWTDPPWTLALPGAPVSSSTLLPSCTNLGPWGTGSARPLDSPSIRK